MTETAVKRPRRDPKDPYMRDVPVSVKVAVSVKQELTRQAREQQVTVSDILHKLIMKHLIETGSLPQ